VDAAFGDFVVRNIEQLNEEKIELIDVQEKLKIVMEYSTKQALLGDVRQKIRVLTRLN
jgi:hypothetical protein